MLATIFLFSTFLSAALGLSCQSIFRVWVCFELNLIRFVGFLLLWKAVNFRVRLKYFLIQSLGSGLLLISVFIRLRLTHEFSVFLLIVSLRLKLAAAPFYGWVMLLAQELDWFSFFLLRRVQKILPLFLLITLNHWRIIWVRVLRALIAAIRVLRETRLKKTIALSSVFGAAWFLRRSSFILTLGYLRFYALSLWLRRRIWSIYNRNEFLANQLRNLSASRFLILLMSLLNFRGLPPFSLFYFKVSILMRAVIACNFVHLRAILGAAVVFIFVYLRIGLSQFQLISESPLALNTDFKILGTGILRLRLSIVFFRVLRVLLSFDLRLNKEIYYM